MAIIEKTSSRSIIKKHLSTEFNKTNFTSVVNDIRELSNYTSNRETFTATDGQTTFTPVVNYTPQFADVWLNGRKLVNGVDVDVSSGTDIILATGAIAGDIIDILSYSTFSVADTYTKAEVDAIINKLKIDNNLV